MPNTKILTVDDVDYDLKDEKGRLGTAAEFSASESYAVGDYCWYDNKLYRFTTAHSSSSWVEAHATEVKVTDELKNIDVETDTTLSVAGKPADAKATGDAVAELKSDVSEDFEDMATSGDVMLFNRYDVSDGYLNTDGSINVSTTLCYTNAYIPVTVGKTIYFSDNGIPNPARFVTAYNSSKVVMSSSGLNYGNTYTVPSGVSYVRISFLKSYTAFQAEYDKVTSTKGYRTIKSYSLPDAVNTTITVAADTKNVTDYVKDYVLNQEKAISRGSINNGISLSSNLIWFYAHPIPAGCVVDNIGFKTLSAYAGNKTLMVELWEERTTGTLTRVKKVNYIPDAANLYCLIPMGEFVTKYPTYVSFEQASSVLSLSSGSYTNVLYISTTTQESISISGATGFNGDLNVDLSYRFSTKNSNTIHIGEWCDYTEIQEALDAITDDSANNPYTFIIHPKTTPYSRFSTLRQLSGTYPWTDAPIRYISIIGMDKYHCVVADDTGDYSTPPAEIMVNGLVKNMTFIASHDNQSAEAVKGAYAVHIDAEPVNNAGYNMQFEDCDFYSDQTAAVGIGLHNESNLSFKNCHFISTADDNYNPHEGYTNLASLGAFNCHSSTDSDDGNQVLTLENCVATSNVLSSYNLATNPNCYMTLKAYNNTFWCIGTGQSNGYKGTYCQIYGANHGNNASALNA